MQIALRSSGSCGGGVVSCKLSIRPNSRTCHPSSLLKSYLQTFECVVMLKNNSLIAKVAMHNGPKNNCNYLSISNIRGNKERGNTTSNIIANITTDSLVAAGSIHMAAGTGKGWTRGKLASDNWPGVNVTGFRMAYLSNPWKRIANPRPASLPNSLLFVTPF